MWTLDELVERVREALEAEYPGAPNGRVRDVPDRRAIRWYSTIGLVDKPLGMRGRTALYGPRHLQQLVAIKRRQAEGLTLAQIQEELTGLSPSSLTDIALVPPRLMITIEEGALGHHNDRPRFWADRPAEASLSPPQPAPPPLLAPVPAPGPALTPEPPPGPGPAPSPTPAPDSGPTPASDPASGPSPVPAPDSFPAPGPASALQPALRRSGTTTQPFTGVALGGGVLLLVPAAVSDRDRDAIAEAAAPLLDLLTARGLTSADGLIDGSPS